jgi:hypothetical protein
MHHPPIVNADSIANLIRQHRVTRDGEPNKQPVTCRTCGVPIPKGRGRRWHTLPCRYVFLCLKCDDQWHTEAETRVVPTRNNDWHTG